ncbi:MAG: DUF3461 family protein [Gammaproteobacteria bacterium]|nr:MAG: DUF3461 family protein [Gammaproteobacteria bacterium]
MYEYLKSIGVKDFDRIERYTLRTESGHDVLKIYYKKEKGDLFHHSVKFKFPRSKKSVLVDSGTHRYEETSEISPQLVHILEELDQITDQHFQREDTLEGVLIELKHLEKVVSNKIREIEGKIERLKQP